MQSTEGSTRGRAKHRYEVLERCRDFIIQRAADGQHCVVHFIDGRKGTKWVTIRHYLRDSSMSEKLCHLTCVVHANMQHQPSTVHALTSVAACSELMALGMATAGVATPPSTN